MTTEILIAQTTIDDEEAAKSLARGAVETRLAACAHIDQPFTAIYRWKDNVETATEWRISFKTTAERLPELQAWVHQKHTYEVPEWITLPVTGGSDAYLAWVVEESTPTGS
ncbi:divalent-cation tolerance protein CutA [Streptomyces sp. SBC-4]|nr:divalent-cation tolerance protein CutA [Streptomyces sp. SBC-4]MDV5145477.1 divalent-cation tolerance protein CutA [Streptomyces sp. SBC-4]